MSRVYFHSPSGTAELRGSERAWLGALVTDVAVGVLDLQNTSRIDRLKQLIAPDNYMSRQDTTGQGWMLTWARDYETAFKVGMREGLMSWKGTHLSTFSMQLNTACVLGNDQLKLAARIHGQCEIHAWVDGPNRAWLAGIMQAGVDAGIYRKGLTYSMSGEWQSQGWEDVIALLRSRDDQPVVMSYSVCDGFPSQYVGDWMARRADDVDEDDHSDAWYDLPSEEQWARSMAALRASSDGLEIKPDDWGSFRFTHELSVLDLYADDWQERLDAAVKRLAATGAR